MIFVKGVLGGICAVLVMWAVVVAAYAWRSAEAARRQGATGLMAQAGGWDYLLHTPWVLVTLTVAFGIGLYVTAR